MFGLTDDELETILTILRHNNIKTCILFGSRAKGNFKKGSDVDIAVLGNDRKLSYCLNEESNLPYFFDVVNLETISNENLKEHIRRVGKRLDEKLF
jgi:predicted nucleotidyltransferase